MLRGLIGIIGIILLLPIAITIVAAIVLALIGGYIWLVWEVCGWLIILIIAVILAVKTINYFTKRR